MYVYIVYAVSSVEIDRYGWPSRRHNFPEATNSRTRYKQSSRRRPIIIRLIVTHAHRTAIAVAFYKLLFRVYHFLPSIKVYKTMHREVVVPVNT